MNIKSIIGLVQKNILVFGINRKYISSLLTFITGTFTIIGSQIIEPHENSINFTYSLAITIGSIALVIYTFTVETIERVKKQSEHIDITPDDYLNYVLENCCLDKDLTSSGYKKYERNGEYYIMSHQINEMLFKYSNRIKLKLTGAFILPIEVNEIVPYAVKKAFDKKSFLFNGKLLRMVDDFTVSSIQEQKKVRLQNTTYFQGLCTNEMVYNRIKNLNSIYSEDFDGYKLSYLNDGQNYILQKLVDSYCANYLGGSTLAVTKDNYIVITRNPKKSDVNSDKLVPSGSGSTDKKDLKPNDTYGSLVKRTMERELREECNINKKINMKTEIIGYGRLLNRGGKPDFWGITYIDCLKDEIRPSKKEMNEMGKYNHEFIAFKKHSDIIEVLSNYIILNKESVALQLYVTYQILENYHELGIDVWSKIITTGKYVAVL